LREEEHVLEPADENGKQICQRMIIYPAEAEGLARVLSPQDVRTDWREELWED
jgi:hypothetical protein